MGVYATTTYIRIRRDGTPYINHVSPVKYLRNAEQPNARFLESDYKIDELTCQGFQGLLNRLKQQDFTMAADTVETAKDCLENDRSGCHRLCIWSSESSPNLLRHYYEACNVMFRAKSTSSTRPNVPDLIEPLRNWARRWRRGLLGSNAGVFGALPRDSSARQQLCHRRDFNRSWRAHEPPVDRGEAQGPPRMIQPAPRRGIRTESSLPPRPTMADRGIRAPLVQPKISPALPTNDITAIRRQDTGDSGIEVEAAPRHMQRISSPIERVQVRRVPTLVQPTPRSTLQPSSTLESASDQPPPTPFVPARRPSVYEHDRHELAQRVQTDMTRHFDDRQRQVNEGLAWIGLRDIWSPSWTPPQRASATRRMAIARDICDRLQEVFGVGDEEIRHPPHPDRRVWLAGLGMRR